MKKWKQSDLWAIGTGLNGCTNLPQGDWSAVKFGRKNRLVFAPNSIIGDDAQLGAMCEIGHHCEIGNRFTAEGGLAVGSYCRFGEDAIIAPGSRISRGTHFGNGVRISGEDVELGDGVEISGLCRLFGVENVEARTLVKIYTEGQPTMYAFKSTESGVHVHMRDITMPLEEFEEETAETVRERGEHVPQQIRAALRGVLAACKYIRTAFMIREELGV